MKDKKLTRGSMATAQLNVGKYQGAIVDFKECVKLKPDHVKGWETLILLGVK